MVLKNSFDKMMELLNKAYRVEHLRYGYLQKLPVSNRLVIMILYYRGYRIMKNKKFLCFKKRTYKEYLYRVIYKNVKT
ncbi:hypothetical protein [Leptotrichia sp. oral taxon 879]|uniref:Transposase n=1 Tax=Leptotrichia mesophila TaxID=3239303 RepID=A0AB39VBU0_9FUSO|nr:hypothetical protein [Leptotrichia sp. oral taxon 879]ERK55886.1 hypothetical protein HMPREF1552_00014 [Leptotrichia sp. oral taxon 879 str. F0557]